VIAVWVSAALAVAPLNLRVPFPRQTLFDHGQEVCVDVNLDLGVPHVEIEDGPFVLSCASQGGHTVACLRVEEGQPWPERPAPVTCEGTLRNLTVRPVPAFDPEDDVWDGVQILRGLSVTQAAFRVKDVEQAHGILPRGACGITDHVLWMKLPDEPREQRCVLVTPTGERVVPIVLVAALRKP
jgi:hypothetical protein